MVWNLALCRRKLIYFNWIYLSAMVIAYSQQKENRMNYYEVSGARARVYIKHGTYWPIYTRIS